jgi:hypothetical protein
MIKIATKTELLLNGRVLVEVDTKGYSFSQYSVYSPQDLAAVAWFALEVLHGHYACDMDFRQVGDVQLALNDFANMSKTRLEELETERIREDLTGCLPEPLASSTPAKEPLSRDRV